MGETMIVLMATGNTPIMDMNLFEGMRTFAANIAVELPESEVGGSHYRILFLTALILFLLTFVFNTAAEVVRQRLRDRYGISSWAGGPPTTSGAGLGSGEIWIWLNAAAVGLAITTLGALFALIAFRGLAHFWPADVTELTIVTPDGNQNRIAGQIIESESLSAQQFEDATGQLPAEADTPLVRWLVKTREPARSTTRLPLDLRARDRCHRKASRRGRIRAKGMGGRLRSNGRSASGQRHPPRPD